LILTALLNNKLKVENKLTVVGHLKDKELLQLSKLKHSVALVQERTMLTEQPPLVGKVIAKFGR
jgi:hypothetical protein